MHLQTIPPTLKAQRLITTVSAGFDVAAVFSFHDLLVVLYRISVELWTNYIEYDRGCTFKRQQLARSTICYHRFNEHAGL